MQVCSQDRRAEAPAGPSPAPAPGIPLAPTAQCGTDGWTTQRDRASSVKRPYRRLDGCCWMTTVARALDHRNLCYAASGATPWPGLCATKAAPRQSVHGAETRSSHRIDDTSCDTSWRVFRPDFPSVAPNASCVPRLPKAHAPIRQPHAMRAASRERPRPEVCAGIDQRTLERNP